MEPLQSEGAIDTGAEEELFRDLGRRAAAEVLARRWESAGTGAVGRCHECGMRLQDLGLRSKSLQTLCGSIQLRRRVAYCGRCHTTAPLDDRLGVNETGITPGLQRVICRVALEMAYEPTQSLLKDTLGFTPCSAREIERIANRHGHQMGELAVTPPSIGKRSGAKKLHCVAIDGTMIPGLPDPQNHRLIWHEVKLATMMDIRDIEAPFYVASTEKAEIFGSQLWRELALRGMDAGSFVQVIADGAAWIWNLADLHFPGVPQLLDFYHAAEHLHKTAVALWPDGIADKWWHRRLNELKTGELGKFFAALKLTAKRWTTSDPDVSPERLLNYLDENRQRLGYAEAIKRNLPIGSGVVESAGRHIVQQRLKQSGMRWSIPGAQAVLNLRTRHRNGQFEQYWENYAAA